MRDVRSDLALSRLSSRTFQVRNRVSPTSPLGVNIFNTPRSTIQIHRHNRTSIATMATQQNTITSQGYQRKLPSERAIAFAIAIVSSKPPGLNVREYITILRQHIAKGRRENALSVVYRHLDRSSYWRSECERTEAKLKAAEADRVEALAETEALKRTIERLKASAASPAKKRKADPDIVPYPRSPKKARRAVSPAPSVASDCVLDEVVSLGAHDGGSKYVCSAKYANLTRDRSRIDAMPFPPRRLLETRRQSRPRTNRLPDHVSSDVCPDYRYNSNPGLLSHCWLGHSRTQSDADCHWPCERHAARRLHTSLQTR